MRHANRFRLEETLIDVLETISTSVLRCDRQALLFLEETYEKQALVECGLSAYWCQSARDLYLSGDLLGTTPSKRTFWRHFEETRSITAIGSDMPLMCPAAKPANLCRTKESFYPAR